MTKSIRREATRQKIRHEFLKECLGACKIPSDQNHMIVEIVNAGFNSIDVALGKLELLYGRVMKHHEEFKKDGVDK